MANMNKFYYSRDDIKKYIKEHNLKKVCMKGVYNNLKRLKPIIEKVYNNDDVFYLDYWVNECAYHGWEWNKDDGTLANQKIISEEIMRKFIEIYALILGGLGEEVPDQFNEKANDKNEKEKIE